MTLHRQHVDSELSRVTGLDTWEETIRGAVATHRLDTRLLRRVLDAKAKQGRLREVVAPLRVMKDTRETRSA